MASPWFVHGTLRNLTAGRRLFCFPFAGGSGHEFRVWGEQLPDTEVLGVLYPGRSSRYTTPPVESLDEMVLTLLDELQKYQDKPYGFFGHSLGSLIAFELARSLRQAGMRQPDFLVISAADAPHLLPKPPILHNLPDAAFLQAIRDFGGTPEAIFEHKELVAMLLPMLRADLTVLETYRYEDGPPLKMPFYALGGTADTVVKKEDLLAWQAYTAGPWQSHFFQGGHFYFRKGDKSHFFTYLRDVLAGTS